MLVAVKKEKKMKQRNFWRLFCVVALLWGGLAHTQPVQAASEWAGITGSGNAHVIYESYGLLNSDLNQIYPFGDDANYQIWQDAYQGDFTTNIDLTACTLYYAENSSTWPTVWSSSSGMISNFSGTNDRCTFTLNLNQNTDYMFYIQYTRTGYPTWYGYPGVSNFTTAPSSQSQTYKIRRNSTTTYQTIRVDGKFGDWSQASNFIGNDGRTPDSTSFYFSWDQDNLYFYMEGGFGNSDRLNIGIDVNPGNRDLSGNNVTTGFAKATFTGYLVPDYIIQSTGTTNLDKYTRSGTGWGSASSIYNADNLYRLNANAEIRVPRSQIGNPTGPIGLYFWLANSSDEMFSCLDIDKPANCADTLDIRLRSALVFDSLGSGQTPSTAGKTDYNSSESITISNASGIRNLYISYGTLSSLLSTVSISGNLVVDEGTTLNLGAASNFWVNGNITCNGTINSSGSLGGVIHMAGADQTISGTTGTVSPARINFKGSGIKTIARNLIMMTMRIDSGVTVNAGSSTVTFFGGATVWPLFINNGTFNAQTSTFAFRGYDNRNARVLGSSNTTFYDVTITCANAVSGGTCTGTLPRFGVDFRDQKVGAESRATIAHSLTLNNSTFVADEENCDDDCGTTDLDGTPIYASGSTLIYNNGGSFNGAAEWKAPDNVVCGVTPGVPHHVIIQNNTALNINAAYIVGDLDNNPIGEFAAGSNKYLCGDLTIASGSSLTSTSGTLSIVGDWTNNGNFIHSNGTVKFVGTDEQQISGSSSTAFNTIYNRTTPGNLILNDLSDSGASAQSFYNYGVYRRAWIPVEGQSNSFGLARLTIAIDAISGSSPSIQVDRIDQDSAYKTGSWPTWGVGNKIYWLITPTNITSVQADLSAPTTAGAGTGLLNGTATLPNGPTFSEDSYSSLCRYTGTTWDCRNSGPTNDNMVVFADATSFSQWALGKNASPTALEVLNLSAENSTDSSWMLTALAGLILLVFAAYILFRKHIA